MKAQFTIRSMLVCLPALALTLTGCAATDVLANPVCDASPAVQLEGFPASIILPAGAVIDSQSSGSPPEYSSNNYQVDAYAMADIDTIQRFYRCALPEQGFPIVGEEQGAFWLLRFGGPGVDDGGVLVGEGRTKGEVIIAITLVEKES